MRMVCRPASVALSCLLFTQAAYRPLGAQDAVVESKLNIVIVEGEGAINNIRQRVAREPIVQVEDENHKPIAGAAVTFLLPNQGAGASFLDGSRSLTVLTNDKGQAIARGLKPNQVSGQYQIRVNASYQGRTGSTAISQSNVAAAAAAGAGISAKVLIILGLAGAGVAGGVIAATRGGGATPTPAVGPPATTISAGASTVGAPK